MSSAVDSTALNDNDSTSNLFKRRRSSTLNSHDTEIDQTPSKRVRPCSPPSSHFLFDNHSQMQTIVTSLNDILENHRNLIDEYVQLQMHDRTDLTLDEQRFIQGEEDLIEKAEKNLYDIHHNCSPPASSSRLGKRQRIQSISSMASPSVDRVKHETHILKRIEELKADGKWTAQRLAKCLEPTKRKTHWDYLLDEMRWLAEDFQLEKRWKQTMAKKISQAVLKYFREKNQSERKLLKELRQRAQLVSKEVLYFWRNMSKIAEWKETRRLEEIHRHQSDDDETSDDDDDDDDEYSLNELEELQDDQHLSIETVLKRRYDLELTDLMTDPRDDVDLFVNRTETKSLGNEQITIDEFLRRLRTFQPTGVSYDASPVDIPVSRLVKYSLREYQHIGLQWLMNLAENHFNCIFADQTGLGKRVVTIALLATLASEKCLWRESLIVVPTRRLSQWEIELKRVAPGLKIFVFYGSTKERRLKQQGFHRDTNFHICLTSYQILRQDFHLFKEMNWFYTIFDRAEQMENLRSTRWQILFDLHAEYRLLLTNGFSLENKSDDEIDSLVDFLLPKFVSKTNENDRSTSSIDILRSLVLSRSKTEVKNQLAGRVEHSIRWNFSSRQKQLFDEIQSEKDETFRSAQIRKLCNHPDLIRTRSIRSSWTMNIDEIRRNSIPKIRLKNPSFGFSSLFQRKFFYFHKRFTLQVTDDLHIDDNVQTRFDDDFSRITLTKEMIERYRNTTLWNVEENSSKKSQKKFFFPNRSFDEIETIFDEIHLDQFECSPWFGIDTIEQVELAMKPCRTSIHGYVECRQPEILLRQLIKSRSDRLDEFQQFEKRFLILTRRVLVNRNENSTLTIDNDHDERILLSIHRLEQQMSIEFPCRSDSGKFEKLDSLLFRLKSERRRCVIFTQMIDMIDLLEEFAKRHSYSYLRFDSTILTERFQLDQNIFLILSSTRFADIQSNLNGDETIIFYDFETNRTIEKYLNECLERENPTKQRHIYRFVSSNSIEEELRSNDQYEEPIDRQAAEDFHRTLLNDFNEFHSDVEVNFDISTTKNEDLIDEQLRPIERYALRFIEKHRRDSPHEQFTSESYFDADQCRHNWQNSCFKAVEEEREKRLIDADDDDDDGIVYTYARDLDPKIWMTEDGQTFEIWSGILQYSIGDNGDYYIDDVLDIGYESEAMIIEPEEFIRFPLPRALADATNTSKSDTNIFVPRSLFDRSNLLLNPQSTSLTTNALNKSKNVVNSPKMPTATLITAAPSSPANLKARQLFVNDRATTMPLPNLSSSNVVIPAATNVARPMKIEENLSKDNIQSLLEIDNSDWLISEDFKVLDAVQNLQQIPLSANGFSSANNVAKPPMMLPNSPSTLLPSTSNLSSSPTSSMVNNTTSALTANWDFISDILMRYSRVLRTPKQCKHRYEQVIVPREEGRVVYDPVKKKKHVIKGSVKLSDDNLQTCRTNQLFAHENCQKLTQIYHQKFETILQCESQISSSIYLNKFKQMQSAQAAHQQLRGPKQGSLLLDNRIQFDRPLTPGDVLYQRSEREKDLKQQQQQQQNAEAAANNPSTQQQQQQTTTSTSNNESIKQISQSIGSNAMPTNPQRGRPSPLNTPPVASISAPSSAPVSIISAASASSNSPQTVQRTMPTNIIVTGNHPNMNPPRTSTNVLPSRANINPSPTPTGTTTASTTPNPPSMPTATIVPGQRTVQVLPTTHLSTAETNVIPPKQMTTVQLPTSEYQQPRTVTHAQPTTPTITNPPTTPTNLQIRPPNLQRNLSSSTNVTTLDVRPPLPTSPKIQPPSTPTRSLSATTRPIQSEVINQTPTKANSTPMPQTTMSVAMVRPLQNSTASTSQSVTSSTSTPSLNLSSINVTLPSNKITANSTTISSNPHNPNQGQLRTTPFLTSSLPNTTANSALSQHLRQLVTNSTSTTFNNPSTNSTTRIAENATRPTSNIQQILASRASLTGQVRNVRIVTLTPSAPPPSTVIDGSTGATSTAPQQAKISFNRSNSSTGTELPAEIAVQLQRMPTVSAVNTDHNDSNPPQRTVYFPARTISSGAAGVTSATAKLKATGSLDPQTLTLAGKTPQGNIVLQIPATNSNTTGNTLSSTMGTDEQSNTQLANSTRHALVQHLSMLSSNGNPRSQSPTTTSTSIPIALRNFASMRPITTPTLTSDQRSASPSSSTTTVVTVPPPPPPPPPPSSSSS